MRVGRERREEESKSENQLNSGYKNQGCGSWAHDLHQNVRQNSRSASSFLFRSFRFTEKAANDRCPKPRDSCFYSHFFFARQL